MAAQLFEVAEVAGMLASQLEADSQAQTENGHREHTFDGIVDAVDKYNTLWSGYNNIRSLAKELMSLKK